jgi:hypothetical protein
MSDSAMVQHLFDSSEDEENIAPEKHAVAKTSTSTARAKSNAVKRKTLSDGDDSAEAPLKSSTATSNKRKANEKTIEKSNITTATSNKSKAKEKTIEEQVKHILNRPDAYGTHFGFGRSVANDYMLLTD